MSTFRCFDCKRELPVKTDGGTGYGCFGKSNRKVCYECCAKRDIAQMSRDGKTTMYFTHKSGEQSYVGNWPGSLKIDCRVRVGNHNMAGRRYDVWFTGPDGKKWHGVTYGDNTQLCHCKRMK